MKPLVLVFHPRYEQSRNNRAWAEAAGAAGFEVRFPGGEPDVPLEQAAVEEADLIVFQHPLHWYGAPWTMKRWIDEVLTFGWAYGGPDRLAGKRWLSAVTVGAGQAEYGPEGSRRYELDTFLAAWRQTAAFCRMTWREPFVRYGCGVADEATIARDAEAFVARLRSERP